MQTKTTEEQKEQRTEALKVTLVFPRHTARLIRQQAKANYLPITQYLKQLILKHLDQQ